MVCCFRTPDPREVPFNRNKIFVAGWYFLTCPRKFHLLNFVKGKTVLLIHFLVSQSRYSILRMSDLESITTVVSVYSIIKIKRALVGKNKY